MIPTWMLARYALFALLYGVAFAMGVGIGGAAVYVKAKLFRPMPEVTVRYVEVPVAASAKVKALAPGWPVAAAEQGADSKF